MSAGTLTVIDRSTRKVDGREKPRIRTTTTITATIPGMIGNTRQLPSLVVRRTQADAVILHDDQRFANDAWGTYGLGTENEDLPGYVVVLSGPHGSADTRLWTSGFLPSVHQRGSIARKAIQSSS